MLKRKAELGEQKLYDLSNEIKDKSNKMIKRTMLKMPLPFVVIQVASPVRETCVQD